MAKQSRNHHYISQCYLRRFTKNNSKKSKITVIDFKEQKTYETSVRNSAAMRDHNTTTMKDNPTEFEELLLLMRATSETH